MFERCTDKTRRVIVLAMEAARAVRHNYIGTEHILLGLITEGSSPAYQLLADMGVTYDKVVDKVVQIIGRGQQESRGHLPFTPRGKKVLDLAVYRVSFSLGDAPVEPIHLLLALLLEGQGVAVQVLQKLDVDLDVLFNAAVAVTAVPPTVSDGLYFVGDDGVVRSVPSFDTLDDDSLAVLAIEVRRQSNAMRRHLRKITAEQKRRRAATEPV